MLYTLAMPRSDSGRVVIQIEPEIKKRLYAALALSGSTLKDWFIKSAARFCDESMQPSLFGSPPSSRESALTAGTTTEPKVNSISGQ
jgi:hypothetical protein